ncbi:Conserved_hypothetical protein [Hexamita inflata]|uniref:Uncharacterized protein n=1 Tax=Hexamita inflata TaxID=28002 RepID=A0AA86PNP1_9EUKA|nr:Conserved hypothetical protein [Hexamita inflata]
MLFITLTKCSAIECFLPTQKIVGYYSTLTLQLVLQPQQKLSKQCDSFSQNPAHAQLNFPITGLQPMSDTFTLDLSQSEVRITFKLANAAQFNSLLAEKKATFTIWYLGSLQTDSVVQLITMMTLDSTACWESPVFKYDIKEKFFNISIVPLTCNIDSSVTIEMQYQDTQGDWQVVKILPAPDHPDGYVSSTAYVHQSVKFFSQHYTDYTLPADKAQVDSFFTQFIQDRDVKLKLVVHTVIDSINQMYSVDVYEKLGQQSNCFTSFPVYLEELHATVNMHAAMVSACSFTGSEQVNLTLVLLGDNTVQMSKVIEASVFQHMETVTFTLDKEWPLNRSVIKSQFYIQFIASNIPVQEMSYFSEVLRSCIDHTFLRFYYSEICLTQFVVQNDFCINHAQSSHNSELLLHIFPEETTYFWFEFTLPASKDNKTINFCVSNINESVKFIDNKKTGSFKSRSKQYIIQDQKLTDEESAKMFMNDNENYFIVNAVMEQSGDQMQFVAVIGALLAVVVGVVLSVIWVRQK